MSFANDGATIEARGALARWYGWSQLMRVVQKNTGATVPALVLMVLREEEYLDDCDCDWPRGSALPDDDCELELELEDDGP